MSPEKSEKNYYNKIYNFEKNKKLFEEIFKNYIESYKIDLNESQSFEDVLNENIDSKDNNINMKERMSVVFIYLRNVEFFPIVFIALLSSAYLQSKLMSQGKSNIILSMIFWILSILYLCWSYKFFSINNPKVEDHVNRLSEILVEKQIEINDLKELVMLAEMEGSKISSLMVTFVENIKNEIFSLLTFILGLAIPEYIDYIFKPGIGGFTISIIVISIFVTVFIFLTNLKKSLATNEDELRRREYCNALKIIGSYI